MSIFIFDWNCLLHKCFVYRPLWSQTKASARCDWLLQSVTDHRKGKEYRGFLLPAVPGAQIYIVRETSRNETLARTFAVLTLNHSRRAKNVYVLRGIEYLRYLRSISSAFHLYQGLWSIQTLIALYCSRKLGGTVILYNELKLFLFLNCFNVDHLLLNFTQSRLVISLWQDLVTAPFILTESEGCQSYSNLK